MDSITLWTTENPKPETPYYKTRSKSKIKLIKNDLPPELIVKDILSRVPANSWQETLKYVCKGWSTIMRDPKFINMHLHHCNLCLYIQGNRDLVAQFIDLKGIKGKKSFWVSLPGPIYDSNDGILLIRKSNSSYSSRTFYAVNPATKQAVKLAFGSEENIVYYSRSAKIVRTNGKVKVIFFARDREEGRIHWYIYTVESGLPCRKVSCPDSKKIKEEFFSSISISVGAVTYWSEECDGQTVALDVNDETCHSLMLPEDIKDILEADGGWRLAVREER